MSLFAGGHFVHMVDVSIGLSPALMTTSVHLSSAHSLEIPYESATSTRQEQTRMAQVSLKASLDQLRELTASGTQAAETEENTDQSLLGTLKVLKIAVLHLLNRVMPGPRNCGLFR